ncbi:hypothetical protein PLIIFM63780_001666 [Purpureocillium lilacinum]|nr:hypothetical protein PLIIFM63780_001666 [Purpureocillium lilacinum]
MDAHEGPDTRDRLSMRRFTTLEGWREVRSGLYLVAGSTISTIIANRTYDPEWQLQDDRGAQPSLRPLVLEAIGQPVNIELGRDRQLPPAKRLSNTTEDRSDCSTQRSSFSLEEKEKLSATEAKVACSGYLERPLPETPFHSFTKKEKWLVIVTVGVAGLFSGLSSNIYFPALDTIAKS